MTLRPENARRKVDSLGRVTLPKGLRDRMYLPELQRGDILVAEEDYTLFIYYHDNYVLDTSENVFKTLDDVKNERIICQVRRLQVFSLQLSNDNLKDTEIWSKAQ